MTALIFQLQRRLSLSLFFFFFFVQHDFMTMLKDQDCQMPILLRPECTIPRIAIPANHSVQSKPVSMPQVPLMLYEWFVLMAPERQISSRWVTTGQCPACMTRKTGFCMIDSSFISRHPALSHPQCFTIIHHGCYHCAAVAFSAGART